MSIRRRRWLELGAACGLSIAIGCSANEGPDDGSSGDGGSGSGTSGSGGSGESGSSPQLPGDGQLDPSRYDAWLGVVSGAIPYGDDPCRTGACRDGAFCVQVSGASCRCSERASEVCSTLDFQTLPLTSDTQAGAASAVSADGSIVLGGVWSMRETAPRVAHTVLWTSSAGAAPQPGPEQAARGPDFGGGDAAAPCFLQSSGMPPEYSLRRVGAPFDVVLVPPAGGELYPAAHSRDCRVVVGSFEVLDAPSRAFRWSVERGVELFEPAPLGDRATGVSDDGNVIVGARSFDEGRTVAVRWNAAGVPEELPAPAWASNVYASAVSADGSVILGYSLTPVQSLRWTSAGVEPLSDHAVVALTLLSADGRVAFGKGSDGVWMWDAAGGLRMLGPLLSEAGVLAPEWDIFEVAGVSADGQVIAGSVTATRETDILNRPTRTLPFRALLRGVQ
jgi:hypothetical protein